MVVHVVDGGTGAVDGGAAPPSTAGVALPVPVVPLPVPVMPGVATPMPVPPLPEHAPIVANTHEKPSPHSASALHGSCHLYMQVETLFVVHVGGVVGAKHMAFAGQAEVPPVHSWYDSVWQTIVAPQSASVAQGASTQKPIGAVPASASGGVAGSATGQTDPAAHATAFVGGGVAISSTQVNPFPQSVAVLHSWARAARAGARRAINAPTETRTFLGDIGRSPFLGEGHARG
jgi:hypothetical protein